MRDGAEGQGAKTSFAICVCVPTPIHQMLLVACWHLGHVARCEQTSRRYMLRLDGRLEFCKDVVFSSNRQLVEIVVFLSASLSKRLGIAREWGRLHWHGLLCIELATATTTNGEATSPIGTFGVAHR